MDIERRRLLETLGALGAAGLAGCGSSDDATPTDSSETGTTGDETDKANPPTATLTTTATTAAGTLTTSDERSTPTPTRTPTATETPTEEPDPDGTVESRRVIAGDGDAEDRFGESLAVSTDGNTVLVGASRDEDPNGTKAGAAYVYRRTDGGWSGTAKLAASDGRAEDRFGEDIAVSGDGTVAVIAAHSGSYVFRRSSDGWTEQTKLVDDTEYFGYPVAVSGDGSTVAVAAWGNEDFEYENDDGYGFPSSSGTAYVYESTDDGWTRAARVLPPRDAAVNSFGWDLSLDDGGETLLVGTDGSEVNEGGTNRGKAFVYDGVDGSWEHQATLEASDGDENDFFGFAAALSRDGGVAVVGAPNDEDPNGAEADDDYSGAGSAYIFGRSGDSWTERDKIDPDDGRPEHNFGFDVAISGDGATVLAGADHAYEIDEREQSLPAYVFGADGGTWPQTGRLVGSDAEVLDGFAEVVAVSADATTAVVSARTDENGNGEDAGTVYVYDR